MQGGEWALDSNSFPDDPAADLDSTQELINPNQLAIAPKRDVAINALQVLKPSKGLECSVIVNF